MSGEGKGTGGHKGMPRSLGLVFRAIRYDFDQIKSITISDLDDSNGFCLKKLIKEISSKKTTSATLMGKILHCIKSPFTKGLGKTPQTSTVTNWEKGDSSLDFTTQHRYAAVSGTRTGALHTISGFYCHFRRGVMAENGNRKIDKDKELDAVIKMAEQHISLCNLAISKAQKAKLTKGYLTQELGAPPYDTTTETSFTGKFNEKEPHLNFIIEFLDAYRENSFDDKDCS